MGYWPTEVVRSRWLNIGQVLFLRVYASTPPKKNEANIQPYYMASSAGGQDDPNRALWLATRAGMMEPSCPLGTTRCIPQAKFPQKPYNKSFIDQVFFGQDGWILAEFFFFACLWTETSLKNKELGQYPAILTSRLVNHPYILTEQPWSIKDLYGFRGNFSCGTLGIAPERAR